MLILGVTTTDPECSLALWRDGRVLAEDAFPGMRACVEELVPRIERLLQSNNMRLGDLDLLAVDHGPGGHTGIKIGLVTVKTLAQIRDIPVAAVSSLDALARAAPPDEPWILPVVHGTAHEVYAATFRGGATPERTEDDLLYSPESAAQCLAEAGLAEAYLIGSGAARVAAAARALGLRPRIAPEQDNAPRARHVCALAAKRPGGSWRDLQPSYLVVTRAESRAQDVIRGS